MKKDKEYMGKQNNNHAMESPSVKEEEANRKKQEDKWNKVKTVNLKGKKVDADPDNESDKPIDILHEPDK